jgi:hypothetical protein
MSMFGRSKAVMEIDSSRIVWGEQGRKQSESREEDKQRHADYSERLMANRL